MKNKPRPRGRPQSNFTRTYALNVRVNPQWREWLKIRGDHNGVSKSILVDIAFKFAKLHEDEFINFLREQRHGKKSNKKSVKEDN